MSTAGQPCPSGFLTPSTEAACQSAAVDLGAGYSFSSSGNWNNHVGGPGCHVGGSVGGTPNGNVHFNSYVGDCAGCNGFRICAPMPGMLRSRQKIISSVIAIPEFQI